MSHHIHYLENKYGVRLFEYNGKKVNLTEAGKVFLSAAITMKDDELHLKKIMEQQSGKGGRLVFGATMTIGEYVMPEALTRFLHVYPETAVQMVVGDTKELLGKLNEGEIEFALVEGFFLKKEYDFLVFASEPLQLSVRRTMSFSGRSQKWRIFSGKGFLSGNPVQEPGMSLSVIWKGRIYCSMISLI